jgi:predicted nucleotidyltransferase
MNKALVRRLTAEVRELVAGIIKENANVIAAYSDGSFAREDMVRGSDLDIGFIVEGAAAEHKIYREIIRDVVFEWGFFDKRHYEDSASILGNAGFTQDLVSAKIWYDPDRFFKRIQRRLRREYKKPELIKLRAVNQLKAVASQFEEFKNLLLKNDFENVPRVLFSIIKHAFAVPSAVLNKPVTNCRAYLYCKRDSDELGFNNYPDSIIEILGSSGFTAERTRLLLSLAYELFNASGLPRHRTETYKAHLEIGDYMIGVGEPAGAAWPVFFWAVGALNEVKRENLSGVARNMTKSLGPIREELRLLEPGDVKNRVGLIERVLEFGGRLIEEGGSGIPTAGYSPNGG